MPSKFRTRAKAILQPAIDAIGYTANSYVDLKSQANSMAGSLIRFDQPPTTAADDRLLRVIRHLRPVAVDHGDLVRVGGDHDGGYVMLRQAPADVAVSIGVGPDVSWDADVASTGVRVHAFDHTVRGLPQPVPGGVFHRIGVGPTNAGKLRSLGTLMRMSGVSGNARALLKMDVEGAEWETLAACPPGALDRFDQIVMELHGLDRLLDERRASDVVKALELLSAGHVPIHVHANNFSTVVRFGNYWFPREIEVSWVHRRLLEGTEPATSLATDLDRPCDPRVSEIDLSGIISAPG